LRIIKRVGSLSWVIKEYAEKVYGVVIDKNDVVDLIRTKKIRH
jgi:hypothetical protein